MGYDVNFASNGLEALTLLQANRYDLVITDFQPFTRYKMSLPYDTTVAAGNLIEHNSVDYYVKSVNLSQSWKAVVRLDLERA